MATLWLVVVMVMLTAAAGEQKIWRFVVGANRRPYNYLDETGKLIGFEVDLLRQVCSFSDEKCTLSVQPFTECIQTVSSRFYPGRGLSAEWFDACIGFVITQDRINSLKFTLPYLHTYAKLAVKPGNPLGVSLETLANHTITHLTGGYTNKQCLTRLNRKAKEIKISPNLPEARKMVLNGTVDAAFSPRTRIPGLETLPNITLHCDLGGVAVMVKKESRLPEWWDRAFKKFVKSGGYMKICKKWEELNVTRLRIKCIDPNEMDLAIPPPQKKPVKAFGVTHLPWCMVILLALASVRTVTN